MTVDILLSHGYCLAEDEHERHIMMPYPPLGILYLSSHLKARGRSVEIYDTTFGTVDGFADRLAALRPRVVGLYCNLMTKGNVLRMISQIRNAGAKVVVGGPEPAPNAAEYLAHGADVVVVGEGEVTLDELLELREWSPDALSGVLGIVYRDHDVEPRATPPRPLVQPLEAQPWPDREAIDLERYLETWKTHHGHSSVSLITSRGCPFTCTWCSHAVFGQTHRRRAVGDVADEVAWIVERYRPDRLWYADDVLTLNRPWIHAYAAELERRGLRLPFECISRADRIDEAIAATLASMGCARLWIGSESGSQRILDRMQRRTEVADVQAKTAMLQARGIEVGMFIMLGYEGEELADLEATVDHLKASMPDVFLTTVAYPIRGTVYYDEVAPRIRAERQWDQRTDRDLKIAGRRSARFYRHATRWMVHEVAYHRAVTSPERSVLRIGRHWLAAKAGRAGMWLTSSEREEVSRTAPSGRGWGHQERQAREGLR